MFLFLIFLLIHLCYAQNYFITSDKNGKENFCATNSSYALTWIDDSVTKTAESTFPHVDQKDFDCDFSTDNNCTSDWIKNSWKLESSLANNIPEIVLDRRWEKFKTYKIKPNNYESVPIPIYTKYIPISIRIKNKVEILLCDSEGLLNCIGFALFNNKIYFDLINNGKSIRQNFWEDGYTNDFPFDLTDKYWKHFLITVINVESDPRQHTLVIKSDDNESIERNFVHFHMFFMKPEYHMIFKNIENTGEGFVKIHDYSYISKTETKTENLGGPIKVINGFVCVSMFIRGCKNCDYSFTLHDETNNPVFTTKITLHTEAWEEIKINYDNIVTKNNIVYLEINKGNRPWNIADIKLCNINNIRTIFTENNKRCQLLSGKDTIETKIGAEHILQKHCPTNAIGPLCTPCNCFYTDNCDSIRTCQKNDNNIECSCSAGFYQDKCSVQCPNGFYGHGCLKPCAPKCLSCDNINGTCYYSSIQINITSDLIHIIKEDVDTNNTQEEILDLANSQRKKFLLIT